MVIFESKVRFTSLDQRDKGREAGDKAAVSVSQTYKNTQVKDSIFQRLKYCLTFRQQSFTSVFFHLCALHQPYLIFICVAHLYSRTVWALRNVEHNPKPSPVMGQKPSPMCASLNTVNKRISYFLGLCKDHAGLRCQLSQPERSVS